MGFEMSYKNNLFFADVIDDIQGVEISKIELMMTQNAFVMKIGFFYSEGSLTGCF